MSGWAYRGIKCAPKAKIITTRVEKSKSCDYIIMWENET